MIGWARVWGSLLVLGLSGCGLLDRSGSSWSRPYPINQVIPLERYWVLLSPRASGPSTEIRFCLKQANPQVPVPNARVMTTVGLLDQTVETLDLRYDFGSQCYRGLLIRPITTARRFLVYVQVGQERYQFRFQ